MKKVLALILAAIMLLAMAACGNKTAANDTSSNTAPVTSETSGKTETTDTAPSGTTETAATNTNTEPEKNAEPKVLNLVMNDVPANAWSPMSNTEYSMEIQGYISGTLYAMLPQDGKVVLSPELAASEPVDVNGDGKTWNISISPDAKWENGEAITADTFMFTFQTVLDPKLVLSNASPLATNLITVLNATEYYAQASKDTAVAWEDVGFKKVDDMTIQVITKAPVNATMVMRHFSTVATAPVYQPLFESCLSSDGTATTYGTAADKIISSGAFKIKRWVDGSLYEFEKNEYFTHADLIKLDSVLLTVVEDKGTQLQLFEQGKVDHVSLNEAGQDQYGDDPRVASVPGRRVYSIEFNTANTEKPIISNENFRLALLYATDRVELGKLTALPPATGLISSTSIATTDGTTFRALAAKAGYEPANNGYDPDLAKKYFDKALEEAGLTSLEITLLCNNGERLTTIAERLQENWTEVFGADKFKMNIDAQPSAQAGNLRKGWKDNANSYEITLTQWNFSGGDYDPIVALKAYTTTYSSRYAPYDDATLNALFTEANAEGNSLDQDKRNQLAMDMEKYILEHAVVVPLVYEVTYSITSDRIIPVLDEYVTGFGWGWKYADIAQ